MRAYSFVKRHEKSLHSFQNNTWAEKAENQNKSFQLSFKKFLQKVIIVDRSTQILFQNATFDRRRNEDFL